MKAPDSGLGAAPTEPENNSSTVLWTNTVATRCCSQQTQVLKLSRMPIRLTTCPASLDANSAPRTGET